MLKTDPRQIQIKDFNYNLPDERIAKYPLEKRDSSKLLVYRSGEIIDSTFSSLTDFLPSDSMLVFNNTKVIQARMFFQKETGAKIEIFCLDPNTPHDYALIFQQTEHCSWNCLVGNAKKWKEGKLSKTIEIGQQTINITAEKLAHEHESNIVKFEWDNPNFTFSDILEAGGELPIPPYLNRATEEKDKETYQTLYSKIKGSVAAPTAGLHFTEDVFNSLEKRGITRQEVTLHVGAGTFKPVKSEVIAGHEMHTEFIAVHRETIESLLNHKGKIIAVGTTSVRTLESLYFLGSKLAENDSAEIIVEQWEPYEKEYTLSRHESLSNILTYLDKHRLDILYADTRIIIAPSYEFKVVDGIVTNFHQPQSTLLLLVSAFVDGHWNNIYEHALANDYRFLSYGDSSLLLR